MINIYLKTASRHLFRNKLYSVINIAGLAIGISCAILAILYVKDEFSYDRFHKNGSQLFRVVTAVTEADGTKRQIGKTGQVQGPAFKAAIPEILEYNRTMRLKGMNLIGPQSSLPVDLVYADENFFRLFSFPLVYGNAATVLKDPFSVVLTESASKKFFGTTDVLGKTLKIEEGRGIEQLVVTGIAKDPPANSSIGFEVVVPFSYIQLMFTDTYWLNQYLTSFVMLQPGADPEKIAAKLPSVFAAGAENQLREEKVTAQFSYKLQPVKDIHLNVMGEGEITGSSSITYSYILLSIVFFIFLMACVNFINLSIAGSVKRSKEIGIRKIAGSSRMQIISHFITEAFIFCLIAFIISIVIVQLVLPLFNQLAGKSISFSILTEPRLFIYTILLLLGCIIAAGLYPAIVLSIFNPAKVLYNRQKLSYSKFFGSGLTVVQFTLAVGLIIATVIYHRQMNYVSETDLGYNPEGVVRIHMPPQRITPQLISSFRNELISNTAIKQTGTGSPVGDFDLQVNLRGKTQRVNIIITDENYLPMLQIPLKEGRNFSPALKTDSSNAVIVNEEFVKQAGLANPIGQQVVVSDDKVQRTIIGVVKDYYYRPLKHKMEPLAIIMGNNEYVLIKLDQARMPAALAAIERSYKKLINDHYYQFKFFDEQNAEIFSNDRRWQKIINFSAILAIVICCIGLYGLAHFMSQQRVKEIGIRKTLGASVTGIVTMLSKKFLKPVFISIIIASPIAWYFMNKWLENFAYRITITWFDFLLAGIAAILIALFTTGLRTFKAAQANPVEGLKNE